MLMHANKSVHRSNSLAKSLFEMINLKMVNEKVALCHHTLSWHVFLNCLVKSTRPSYYCSHHIVGTHLRSWSCTHDEWYLFNHALSEAC